MTTTTARIYVGTYAKYNSGSIEGQWLNLDDYRDKDAFLEACAELHKDEADPELMFQDHEGIPYGMVSECHVDDAVWEFIGLSAHEQEIVRVYRSEVNQDGTIAEAQESFAGVYPNARSWAEQFWEDCGMLREVPEFAQPYIDYEAYAHDAEVGGDMTFVRHQGEVWVFTNR